MKKSLKGKFVIGFDTICDGNQCVTDENNKPVLFSSRAEAMKELFEDAYSMLEFKTPKELKERGISKPILRLSQMKSILTEGKVEAMEKFLNDNPEMNDNNEFVEKAEEFILGRKAIFTGKGLEIQGKKL